MKPISKRVKEILLLLLGEKCPRSLGYIARKINMLYPNIHVIVTRMEYRDKLIETSKYSPSKNNDYTRLVFLTDKGRKLANELKGI